MADLKLKVLMEAENRISGPLRNAKQATGQLKTGLAGAAEKVRVLERASKDLSAYKKLRADSKATAGALNDAREKAARMGKALADAGGGTKKAQKEFKAARNTINRLQAVMEQQTAKADRLRQSLSKNGVTAQRFGREVKDLTGTEGRLSAAQHKLKRDLEAARGAMERQTQAAKRMRQEREKMAGSMRLSGKVALAGGASAGVAYGAKNLIDNVMEPLTALEAARGELSSLGMDQAGQNAVVKQAKATSLKIAGLTADSFVRAAYDIKSGISSLTSEGVAEMTRAAAMTAKATKATPEAMTSLFATGYGVFKRQFDGLSDGEFGAMFSASIAKAVQAFKTTGEKMQQSIQSAGSLPTNLGMSLSDQFATLGMLQGTMEAGEAGTSLRAFSENAAKAQANFDKLGNGVSVLTTDGKLRGMADILVSLKDAYGDTLDAMEAQQIQKAFGTTEAMKLVNNLWGMDDAFRAQSKSLRDAGKAGLSYTQAMVDAAQDNYADRSLLLAQRMAYLKITIGQALLPTLEALIARVGPLIIGFSDWIERNQGLATTIGGVVIAVGAIAAVLSPLLIMASSMIGSLALMRYALTAISVQGGLAAGAMKLLTGGFGLAAKAATTLFPMLLTGIKAVGMAFMTNPIGIALVAIAVAAALVIAYWEPIKGFFADLWGGISASFSTAWDVVMKGIEAIKGPLSWISGLFDKVFGGGEAAKMPQVAKPGMKIASTVTAAALAAPIAAGTPAMAAPSHFDMGGVTIHIQAEAGQDATDIGKAVRRELEKMMAEKERAGRSRLYDEVD